MQLWRSLDERPDHLRGLEAAVIGIAAGGGEGQGDAVSCRCR